LLFVVMLLVPVGLSSLSLVHAMEMNNHIHEQHQCEIYDVIRDAVTNPINVAPYLSKSQCFRTFNTLEATVYSKSQPRTRSPPKQP